ncbi:head closure [Mycobacterium phage Corndog]|uniref:Head-to-tail stopper n=1 Tax=Mycobacterium phage Corndog TaxID=205875 RepID=Q856P9_BPMCO|nr:head closure [Mycobacterium phage Corndog]AAN01977.1 head-to-tail stopper [Mycobacterium phage Corndog]
MPFGASTVTFVVHTDGATPGELGTYPQVKTEVSAPGCRHRPLTFRETAELQFDVATQIWKTTLPVGEYSPTLLSQIRAVQPDDTIRVDGVEYSIIGGVQIFDDFAGPFKATIISKRHIG